MEFLNTAALAHFVYSMFSAGHQKTKSYLKEKLQGWVFDEDTLEQLSERIDKLQLESLPETEIKARLDSSDEVSHLLKRITFNQSAETIVQTHHGSGDNVGGNKVYLGKDE